MTQTEQASEARTKLLLRRENITRSRANNEASALELGAERRGDDVAEHHDLTNALVRLSDFERAELHEVDAALDRLSRGTWGRCEHCGEAIEARRLTALPQARRCSNCMS
jgi:DnaK suppressor protein